MPRLNLLTTFPATPDGRIERRSGDRPRFAEGWRKEIAADSLPNSHRINAGRNLVEIWTASPRTLLKAKSCLQLLDDADRAELGAIKSIILREAALATRILLRLALSRACNHCVPPGAWRFERLESGKLQVAEAFPQIRFSISHNDSLVGVAVSPSVELGFDIESVDAPISIAVKEAFLTQHERRRLSALRTMQGRRGAIRIWTLKEAFSKLVGRGLADEFRDLDFRIFPRAELASQENCAVAATHFESLYVEGPDSLYLATLAVSLSTPFARGEIQFLNLVEDATDRTSDSTPPQQRRAM
jgi:4'-phosphopantetheinyl transferase